MPPIQPTLFPEPCRTLTLEEVAELLGGAIRAGAAGGLSRHADTFLATICANLLATRLEQAGVAVVKRPMPDLRRG